MCDIEKEKYLPCQKTEHGIDLWDDLEGKWVAFEHREDFLEWAKSYDDYDEATHRAAKDRVDLICATELKLMLETAEDFRKESEGIVVQVIVGLYGGILNEVFTYKHETDAQEKFKVLTGGFDPDEYARIENDGSKEEYFYYETELN